MGYGGSLTIRHEVEVEMEVEVVTCKCECGADVEFEADTDCNDDIEITVEPHVCSKMLDKHVLGEAMEEMSKEDIEFALDKSLTPEMKQALAKKWAIGHYRLMINNLREIQRQINEVVTTVDGPQS